MQDKLSICYCWSVFAKFPLHELTIKCIGSPLGPSILFFVSPVKTRKDSSPSFFCNTLNISYASLGEENDIAALLSLLLAKISIIAQCDIGLFAIFKQNNFVQNLFQKCKCIYVLLLWAKFYWKIPLGKWFLFSNFRHVTVFVKQKFVVFFFGRLFETIHFLKDLFSFAGQYSERLYFRKIFYSEGSLFRRFLSRWGRCSEILNNDPSG